MIAKSVSRFFLVRPIAWAALAACLGASAACGAHDALRAGGVSYLGEQRAIFATGHANATVSLTRLAGISNLYALGPVAGLDGEITIFDSRPFVSKVRGDGGGYVVDRTFDHGAIFLVWAQMRDWDDVPVPETVSSYGALEAFVKETARRRGIETEAPFPFLMTGRAREIVWHINVDRTEGKPITRELFRKSKQHYTLRAERVDIFGVYSQAHDGVFMPEGAKIHIHLVSRDTAATGHIDAIAPGSLMLRLPRR